VTAAESPAGEAPRERPAAPSVLRLGSLELESGAVLEDARLAYRTHGTLSPARDNAILYPHMYSGSPSSLESTIAPGRALDPERWFVICPAQLGGGLSSSPSTSTGPFPEVTVGDDVTAQGLLLDALGIERVALALGFSMGAQQAYEWAVRHPDRVQRLAAVAGTARTTPNCGLAVRLAEEALEAGGLELHARAWAPVGLSAELFRTEAWREAGYASVDDLVQRLFVDDLASLDPADLLCQCRKWRAADVGRHAAGDLAAALGRITAETFVLPFSNDLLFPVEDCAAEARLIPRGELRVIQSPWGHWSWEMTEGAREALDRNLAELLARPA
jgi:homoserine O-acetyltransferase